MRASGAAGHWAQLTYERSRAGSGVQALQATWQAASARRHQRAALSGADRQQLLDAELACLRLGLAWPREAQDQRAPWQLPARVLQADAVALPAHPLIDPAWAVERMGVPGSALALIDALGQPDRRAALWAGLPLAPPKDVSRLGVVVHLFYPALWPEIRAALAALPEVAALYLTVPEFAATPALRDIVDSWPGPVQVVPLPNRGRDVRPFLHLLRGGALDAHELVCKLHTKRSPHIREGAAWRQASLQGLLGSPELLAERLARMRGDAGGGLWCAESDLVAPEDRRRWTRQCHRPLQRQLALQQWTEEPGGWSFAAGTMFWLRPAALQALRGPAWTDLHNYEPEMAQLDGTWAHALERLIGLAVRRAGFQLNPLAAPRR
ncbi:rhamnan synthesis F family protein [Roseateles cellulosilyticus]|uniref:Rhamnan synthesis F n=1 Tax=Pelomonas cellulosilytica TaxID=2906762 RepID=A0ABS8Y346_9BURK|nr:rhamnan synthesis F family protein [Pelomonas sp. P8]MCE4557566.1 hypothetical protein [Pelomonas sp. P8]